MPGRRTRIKPLAAWGLFLFVLLGVVLLGAAGCNPGASRPSDIGPSSNIPAEKTEAEFLLELEKKFENPQAHYELARFYHRQQQWTKAEQHYDWAISFDPAYRAAQASKVKMFVDRGETAKGEQYGNSYIGQAGRSGVESTRLAWEFEKLGLGAYALRCFSQALVAAPDSYEVNKQIGFYHLGRGDTTKAKKYLQRSFELNPRQPDVSGALGRLGVVVESPEAPPMTMEKK
jgi:tetratricopeptide (TPR) repeat protein